MINTKKKKGITIAILAVIAALCLSFGLAALLGAFGGGLTESPLTVFAATGPVQTHEWWHMDEDAIDLNTYVTQNGTTLEGGASEKSAKHYCLSADLTSNITIGAAEDGSDSYVELCLNGYMLKGNGQGTVVTINNGGNLSLYDCPSGRTHAYAVTSNKYVFGSGSLSLVGGVIAGGTGTDGVGGGVLVTDGGAFTLYNGTVAGNNATNGGGVAVDGGTFRMEGGAIAGNTATYGAGLYLNETVFELNNGTIAHNTATTNGGGVYMDKKAELTMNGGKIGGINNTISGNAATDYGGGLYSAYVGNKITMTGGVIGGASAAEGNTATQQGGGVYLRGDAYEDAAEDAIAEFLMEGGTIAYNTAANNTYSSGGGLLISSKAKFTMQEGKNGEIPVIKGNAAHYAGGGVVVQGGTFNLKEGLISGNTAGSYAGGVSAGVATFLMEGGTITDNTATEFAGGIYLDRGTATMTGGTISNNRVTRATANETVRGTWGEGGFWNYYGAGGGLYVMGNFTMTGGIISRNTAHAGAGLLIGQGMPERGLPTFTMTGGTITENTATGSEGGGVLVKQYGTVILSGAAKIYGNIGNSATNNVYLPTGYFINVTDALEKGAKIGVTTQTAGAEVTKDYAKYNKDAQGNVVKPDNYFFSDAATHGSAYLNNNNEVQFNTSAVHMHDGKSDFGTALTATTGNIEKSGTYYLASGVTLTSALTITGNGWTAPEGSEEWERVEVTLCLGGYTLSGNGGTSVIEVTNGAKLTICDCRDTGTISRTANTGTVIYVNGGELTLEAGKLTNGKGITINVPAPSGASGLSGNQAVGGGMYVTNGSKVTMTGGVITGNVNLALGGGVYADGGSTFTMEGGTIKSNTAKEGGGVTIHSAEFILKDGLITENSYTTNGTEGLGGGGGVRVIDGAFTMWNGKITKNNHATIKAHGGGVMLVGKSTFTMHDGEISGHTANWGGGVAMFGSNTFNMYGGTISGNSGAGAGGVGLHMSNTFNMYDGTISGNSATNTGGGVELSTGNSNTFNDTLNMSGGIITGNTVTGPGGGVWVGSGVVHLSGDAKIERNTGTNGGGVYVNTGCTLTLEDNAAINFNTAATDGGGVWSAGTFTMDGGSVSYNTANGGGGGVAATSGIFTMNGGAISYNATPNNSGGVSVYNTTFDMNGGEISYNTATTHTGGVYLSGASSTFNMWDGKIIGNASSARNGGGVLIDVNSTMNFSGGEISRNSVGSTAGVTGAAANNNYLVSGGGGIYVHGTLNMTGGVIKENSSYIGGGIIIAKHRSTDQATANIYGGEIINNYAEGTTTAYFGGGGVALFNSGTLNLGGDASISYNKITSGQGGGVEVYRSTFNMYGGTISHNTSSGRAWASGVFIYVGTFTMNGGSVSYNVSAERGGGVYGVFGSTLNLNGGVVSYNTARRHSAGVGAESATINLSGTVISHNTSKTEGGAGVAVFYDSAEFNMTGGVISYNEVAAFGNGGGGILAGGNTANGNATLNITGGVITGNKINGSVGGGVYQYVAKPELNIGGTAQIYGNYEVPAEAESAADYKVSDVYLLSNQNITIPTTAALTSGAKIGVAFANAGRTGTFATGYNASTMGTDAGKYFFLNDGRSVTYSGTNVQVGSKVEHNHNGYGGTPLSVNKPVSPDDGDTAGVDEDGTYYLGENGYILTDGTYYLTEDITTNITISGEVELCLNGYKMTTENGSVITVKNNGKLTLHDCQGSGAIMGGTGTLINDTTRGGGIYLGAGGELIMDSGVIQYNKADLGGAIYAAQSSNVLLSGTATIGPNEATLGGGIYVSGSILTLKEDSKILSSTAENGGGVYLDSGLVALEGGQVTGNRAQNGGGIYANGGTVLISGGSLYGNAAEETEDENGDKIGGNGAAIYACDNTFVTVSGGELFSNVAKRGAIYVAGGSFDFKGGRALRNNANQGAVVYVAGGKFNLTGGSLINNTADQGGAIYVGGGEANIYSTVGGSGAEANMAVYGGGVAVSGGTLNIEDGGVISYNTAYAGGGGAYVNGGSLYLKDGAAIAFNTAKIGDTLQNGGGAYIADGTLYVLGGTISNNTATTGGGVYVNGGTLDMSAGTIADHTGVANGGGVYVACGTFELSGTGAVKTNTATTNGGGAYIAGGEMLLRDGGAIRNNESGKEEGFGGGVYIYGGEVNMSGGEISGNTAHDAAGVFIRDDGLFTMSGGAIQDNNAIRNTGGVQVNGTFILRDNGKVINNKADKHTGGVWVGYSVARFYMYGGEISNNTAGTYSGGVTVRYEGALFEMYGGKITGNTATTHVGGVTLDYEVTFNMYGGEISGNIAAQNGGGVYVGWADASTFNMYGGTIENNTATANGGGVYMNAGEFNFYGGEVSGNTALSGGGVYMASGELNMGMEIPEDVELPEGFELTTPTIDGNKTTGTNRTDNGNGFGGGVHVASNANATFNMYDGKITGNHSSYNGAGVNLEAGNTFNMSGGEISGNHSEGGEGGVRIVQSKFNMSGGSISNNSALTSVAGVWVGGNVNTAIFTMTGGTISGNVAMLDYGGVCINMGVFNMYGGKITDNQIHGTYGAGVWVMQTTDVFNICGDVEISGNKANGAENNVHLSSGRIINVTGKLGPAESEEGETETPTRKIGVTMATAGTFTTGMTDPEGYKYFFSDSARYMVAEVSTSDKNAKLTTNTGAHVHGNGEGEVTFDNNLNTSASSFESENNYLYIPSGNYYLSADYSIANPLRLVVNAGEEVKICLNGFSLIGNNGPNGNVTIAIYGGKLTVCDCGTTGKVTHATNTFGTNIGVDDGGEVILEGGTVTGGGSNAGGGGVWIEDGTFIMNGGSIKGITRGQTNGGGVHVTGTNAKFIMNGGTISGNTATNGGGVAVVDGGEFEMNGGSIRGNNSGSSKGGGVYVKGENSVFNMKSGDINASTATNGGGVYVESGTFNMSGGTISGNTATAGGGVYVEGEGSVFNMNGGSISSNSVSGTGEGSAGGGGGVNVCGGGTFNMNGGVISNNKTTVNGSDGAGVSVHGDGTVFNMFGGSITNNQTNSGNSSAGGGVSVYIGAVKFNMYGGEISGNTAGQGGGAVWFNLNTFNMYGGTISGNTAPTGGGVHARNAAGIFNMGAEIPAEVELPEGFEKTVPTIKNNTAQQGGGVYVEGGTFTMENGLIDNNTATGGVAYTGGGGVQVAGGTFNLKGGTISNNKLTASGADGGGVAVSAGSFTMSGGKITGNTTALTSGSDGGGVIAACNFIMSGGEITENSTNAGGGVFVVGSYTFTMTGGMISGNTATNSGGGVIVNSGTFNMRNGENGEIPVISGNTAQQGGGVFSNGTFTMSSGTISGNTAQEGGGVYLYAGTFTMSGTALIDTNTAETRGGGVYQNAGTFNMTNGKITGNTTNLAQSSDGGGVAVIGGEFLMTGGEISGNKASEGGGVYSIGAFTMSAGTISGNSAMKNGGGVFLSGSCTFTMNGGTIVGNTAANAGGGVWVSGTFNMSAGKIEKNTAYGYAGGVAVYSASIGTLTVSGTAVIIGNTVNGVEENVCLQKGKTMAVGALNEGARIGVTLASNYVAQSPFTTGVTATTKVYANNYILADDGSLCVWANGSNQLYLAAHELRDEREVVDSDEHYHYYTDGCKNPLDSDPVREAHTWGEWGEVNSESGEQFRECLVNGCGAQNSRILEFSGILASADTEYMSGQTLTNVQVKYVMRAEDGTHAEFTLASADYEVIYQNGGKTLLYGDTSATIMHERDGVKYYATINDIVIGRAIIRLDVKLKPGVTVLFNSTITYEDLKAYLVVTGIYDVGEPRELEANEYTLDGIFGVGPRLFTATSLNGVEGTITINFADEYQEDRAEAHGSLAAAIAEAKKKIDESRMTDAQKEAAKDIIDEKGKYWQDRLDEERDPENFGKYEENFNADIFDVLEEARVRTETKKKIDDILDEFKDKVDALEKLTEEQKGAVKRRADELNQGALDAVDASDDWKNNFNDIVTEYEEELNKLLQDENLAEKADFWNDLEQHAKAKKEYVDSREDLPPEEKERRKNAIDEEVVKGNEAIRNAESVEEAQKELDDAKLIISRIADENYDKKEEAKDEIDKAAQNKKDEIDGRDDLLPGDKEAAKKAVDEEAAKAKDNIDKAITPEGVQKALDDGLAAIEEAGTPAKPHEIGGMIVIIAIETLTILGLGTAGVIIKKKKGL